SLAIVLPRTPFPSNPPPPLLPPPFPYTTLFRSHGAVFEVHREHLRCMVHIRTGDNERVACRAHNPGYVKVAFGDQLYCRCFPGRSEEHTSELQSSANLVCRLLLEKKKLHRLTVQ